MYFNYYLNTRDYQISAGALQTMLDSARVSVGVTDTSAVAAGSAASFTALAGSLSATDGYYVNAELLFTSGALAGQQERVTAYTAANHKFTFDFPFSAAPGAGDAFTITTWHLLATNDTFQPTFNAATSSATPNAELPYYQSTNAQTGST